MGKVDRFPRLRRSRAAAGLLVFVAALLVGCAPSRLIFVSGSGGADHLYRMAWEDWPGGANPVSGALTTNPSNVDRYPDVSPDGVRLAYVSQRAGEYAVVVRDLVDATGATETLLAQGPAAKIWPRWSRDQGSIAYAELSGPSNQARIMVVAAGGGTPVALTSPAPGESDDGGHDYFANGTKIVFSRRSAATHSYELFVTNADSSGAPQQLTASPNANEILPVTSHDGALIAYVTYVPLAAGWVEAITVLEAGTWIPRHSFQFQPPQGARRIGALAFSHDDQRLYIAAREASVSATSDRDRFEIFAVSLDGSDPVRLTSNDWFDSQPSAIPASAAPMPPPCLVSWWPGDGSADDVAGTNHGTLKGGAGFAPGVIGSAFSFDGVDDYVLVAPNANLNITGDLTIVLWAKLSTPASTRQGSAFVWQGNISGPAGTAGAKGAFNFGFGAYTDQVFAGFFTPWGGSFGAGGPSVTDLGFHHYAYVRSGGGATVTHYFDGALYNSHTFSSGPGDASGLPLVIGALRSDLIAGGYGEYFPGLIDEVAVFNCALSAEQIATIYQRGVQALAVP